MAIFVGKVSKRSLKWMKLNPDTSKFLRKYTEEDHNISKQGYFFLISLLANILPDDSFVQALEKHSMVRAYRNDQLSLDQAFDHLKRTFTHIKQAFDILQQKLEHFTDLEEKIYLQELFKLLTLVSHADRL